MDLTPTPEQEAVRHEIRTWLKDNLPWEYGVGLPPAFDDLAAEVEFLRGWQQRLAAGRWVGVHWPERYGGRGSGAVENFVVQEELSRARAPELAGRIGVNLVGPTLLAHGTDDQKQRWLPRILPADDVWCQLFSEPGAGSDLASLSTRATQVDGGWLVTGQKVWTSYAQFADWGICLARTNPDVKPQAGISYLVVDMRAPGVEVRPLRQITDESDFNEVFLTDVFVPDDQVVGAVDDGWRVANSTLSHERGVNARQMVIHLQLLEELLRLAESSGAFDDAHLAPRLAQAFVEVKLFQLLNGRTLSRLAKGREPGPEASTMKLYWSEMTKRLHDLVLDVLGDSAPLWRHAEGNPGDGRWQRSWLYYQAFTVAGGTSEIQRNIIGERVLGLPR